MHVVIHQERYGHFPNWHNEDSPWHMDYYELSKKRLSTFDEHFPLVSDFEIILESYKGSIRDYEVHFYSQEKGGIITTTLFSDAHLRQPEFTLPLNFDDLDQNWKLTHHLNCLSLSSSGGWWAVGEKGVMIQVKARSYYDSYRLDIGSLYAVSMLSEEDGWCFGAQGVMLRYNGSRWEIQPRIVQQDLRGSHFLSSTEGWCVGQGNTILHYQQGAWTQEM